MQEELSPQTLLLLILFLIYFRLILCHVLTIRTSSILLGTVTKKNHSRGWWCLSMLQMEAYLSTCMVTLFIKNYYLAHSHIADLSQLKPKFSVQNKKEVSVLNFVFSFSQGSWTSWLECKDEDYYGHGLLSSVHASWSESTSISFQP